MYQTMCQAMYQAMYQAMDQAMYQTHAKQATKFFSKGVQYEEGLVRKSYLIETTNEIAS
jgi:hypothetical protein